MGNLRTNILVLLIFFFLSACNLTFSPRSVNRFDRHGRKHKLWIEPIDSSSVMIANYRHGLKQGRAKIQYTSGSYVVLKYKNNIKNGTMKVYSEEGTLCSKATYEDGNIVN